MTKAAAGQTSKSFERRIAKTVGYRYLLFLPEGYGEPDVKWPMILFLHGAGERGDDIDLVKKHGPPKIVEEKADFPFVVVSPQCPEEHMWNTDALAALVDEVTGSCEIDESRIYVTGLSMGGFGTWALACECPERFAAIAPVCGGGFALRAARLAQLPVWAFHGALDQVVPLEMSAKMVRSLRDAGGDVRFTVYPTAEHDSWTETYANPELYEWFLKHRRKES